MDKKRGANGITVMPPVNNLKTTHEGQVLVSGVKEGHK